MIEFTHRAVWVGREDPPTYYEAESGVKKEGEYYVAFTRVYGRGLPEAPRLLLAMSEQVLPSDST